jgi:hypothetical protein
MQVRVRILPRSQNGHMMKLDIIQPCEGCFIGSNPIETTKLLYMSLCLEKIERLERLLGRKSHSRKWRKNQRNRKIRRVKNTDIPNIKHCGWEY